jgi:hypothetical protein
MNPPLEDLKSEVTISPRRWLRRVVILAAFFGFLLVPTLFSQDAVPTEILQRTLFIKVGNVTGTAFTIDYQGKIYVVTARHMVAGLPETKATIQVWRAGSWADYPTVRILFPPSSDADIAVLETDEKISQPYTVGAVGSTTFGQQVWFLGYPQGGLGTYIGDTELPFIKRGTMSAIDSRNPDAVVLYVDGFNNPGFSGGPIVFWDFGSHTYQIIGVVKGYRDEAAKMLVNGAQLDTNIIVNSGILVGYSIHHAIQAIEQGQKKP